MDETLNFDHKIFDNYQDLVDKQKRNNLIKIYKIVLLSLIGLFSLFTWIFIRETIMGLNIFKALNRSLYFFLNFEDPTVENANAMIIFKDTILLFVLFYSLIKNYMNLYFEKELIKRYWIWFSLYLSISVVSFVLLFAINSSKPLDIFSLVYLLIPLFLINIAHEVYSYWYKSKSDPTNFSKKTFMIISLAAQGLIIALLIIILNVWIFSGQYKDVLFYFNKFNDFVKKLFTIKSAGNLLIILSFSIISSLLIIASLSQKIVFLINKQYSREYFKYQIQMLTVILLATIVWFVSILFVKPKDQNIFTKNKLKDYWFLFEILFASLVLTSYCLLVFKKSFKTKSNLLNTIYFSAFQFLLWLSLAIINLYTDISIVNLINLLVCSIVSMTMLLIYILKRNTNSVITMILISILIVSNIVLLVIFGINQIMLSYSNYAFYAINSKLYLTQIFLIINLTIAFMLLVTNYIDLSISLHKMNSFKFDLEKK